MTRIFFSSGGVRDVGDGGGEGSHQVEEQADTRRGGSVLFEVHFLPIPTPLTSFYTSVLHVGCAFANYLQIFGNN